MNARIKHLITGSDNEDEADGILDSYYRSMGDHGHGYKRVRVPHLLAIYDYLQPGPTMSHHQLCRRWRMDPYDVKMVTQIALALWRGTSIDTGPFHVFYDGTRVSVESVVEMVEWVRANVPGGGRVADRPPRINQDGDGHGGTISYRFLAGPSHCVVKP